MQTSFLFVRYGILKQKTQYKNYIGFYDFEAFTSHGFQ